MKKVWRRVKKLICFTLAVACLSGMPTIGVTAAEENLYQDSKVEIMEAQIVPVPEGYFDYLQNTRAVLTGCRISVSFSGSGMGITAHTGTTDVCPVVGVKNIKVEQKVWYGWKEVAYSTGAEVRDTSSMAVSVTYTGAVKDETYRVSCVHYADLTYDGVTQYTEGAASTGAFVFTY
ncbi:MAG: hypothetical protein E7291_01050 [Lachnospiraceae bacterium]|nr:hypothetical protein [Lachnospiraceae bacterium]